MNKESISLKELNISEKEYKIILGKIFEIAIKEKSYSGIVNSLIDGFNMMTDNDTKVLLLMATITIVETLDKMEKQEKTQ